MKKILSSSLVVFICVLIVVVFSLIGCKTATTTTAAATETTQVAGKKFTVGYDIYWTGNAWSLQLAEEFKYAIQKEYSDVLKNVYYTSSDGDASKNLNNFEDLVAKGCDIIFILPITPDNLVKSINNAMDKGIKVVVFGSAINSHNYTAFVNISDYDWGVKSAEYIAKAVGGKGTVAMINGIAGTGAANDTHAGAMSVFKKYPDINTLPEVYGDWDSSKTKIVMRDLLAAHPKIDGIWTFSEPGSIIEVYIEDHLPFVPIVFHGENREMKYWKEYKDKGLEAEVVSKPSTMSVDALHIGMAALMGKPYEKENMLPVPTYTYADIDKLILPDLPDRVRVPTYLPKEKLKELFK
ncbi:MAG: substrate-binding domain-containing protein [Actinobacteria bacterium]|nr:substrate-binding domain-containing protein [Actinomycetota bacterium]